MDKVVFITGAGSGIGKATARKLVSLGAKVYTLTLKAEEVADLTAELGDSLSLIHI